MSAKSHSFRYEAGFSAKVPWPRWCMGWWRDKKKKWNTTSSRCWKTAEKKMQAKKNTQTLCSSNWCAFLFKRPEKDKALASGRASSFFSSATGAEQKHRFLFYLLNFFLKAIHLFCPVLSFSSYRLRKKSPRMFTIHTSFWPKKGLPEVNFHF